MDTKAVENIFMRSDFSRETDLKIKLGKELFPVKRTTLTALMEEEGIKSAGAKKESGKEALRTVYKERGKEREAAGVLERDNPLIRKNKPPVM